MIVASATITRPYICSWYSNVPSQLGHFMLRTFKCLHVLCRCQIGELMMRNCGWIWFYMIWHRQLSDNHGKCTQNLPWVVHLSKWVHSPHFHGAKLRASRISPVLIGSRLPPFPNRGRPPSTKAACTSMILITYFNDEASFLVGTWQWRSVTDVLYALCTRRALWTLDCWLGGATLRILLIFC